MKCKKVERLLSSYLDNSLNIINRDEVKKHLAECQKCMDCLNTMTNIDNLIKLKIKEKPSQEYWESYWSKLESKLLDRTMVPQPSQNRRLFNRFIPKFAFALNGILIALLIFVSGLLHIRTQEVKLFQYLHEEMQQQICKYLLHPETRISSVGIFHPDISSGSGCSYGAKANVQILDRYDKI